MRFLGVIVALILLLYPPLVYFGTQWFEPRWLGLIFACAYLLRLVLVARLWWQRSLLVATMVLGAALLWWVNSETLLKLLPAGINLGLAGYFGCTLWYPPSIPTRVATLEYNGNLPPVVERYTVAITRLWCGFFIVNAVIALVTALFFSREVWALYNGLLAYIAIGLVFALEYAYRILIFHKKHAL
ncbi:COG4648 family protein [Gilvimarinus agarilyticus]|uniref:COG4648 family protein n=1 Tax=Gilvimarinus agarilyticus TaxID=679259 RepID=UPI0005A25EBE|nr:hypothetical protein [Gilvimarinus agarilyticus]